VTSAFESDRLRTFTPNRNVVLHFYKRNGARMESAITVKGQATIPRAIREHLRLKPGNRVKFFVHPDGTVVLLPKLPASVVRGIIKSRNRRPVTVAEMADAVAVEGAARVPPRNRNR
jgi:AbrB family looped-hinge helix DNA binding protein